MTCKICDLCGKELPERGYSYTRLVFADSVLGTYMQYDLHSQCADRVYNKVNAFIKEARQQEGNDVE